MVIDSGANPGSAREAWSRPTARVDWLQGPLLALEANADDPAAAWLHGEPERTTTPGGVRGYDRWLKDQRGTLIGYRFAWAEDEDRKVPDRAFLILKGSGLTELRAEDVTDHQVLHRFAAFRGTVNRLDLALDVKHPEVTPKAFFDQYGKGQVVTRLPTMRWMQNKDDGGSTFYLQGGEVLVRVYDKTAERARKGVTLEPGITRLEMELKGPSARSALKQLLAVPPANWDAAFPLLACAWFQNKVRPLGVKVPRNPQRIPTWAPLLAAFDGIGPVRLGRAEADRALGERVAGLAANFENLTKGGHLRMMKAMLGDALFNQAIERGELDSSALEIVGFMNANPERAKQILADAGLDLRDEKTEDPQRSMFDE